MCSVQRLGLVDYPATPAPSSGTRTVATKCADNAHRTSSTLNVVCSSRATWISGNSHASVMMDIKQPLSVEDSFVKVNKNFKMMKLMFPIAVVNCEPPI